MSEPSVGERLPTDTMIETRLLADGTMRIMVYMTLENPDHARALVTAIQTAVLPLLELRSPTTPGLEPQDQESGG